MEFFVNYWYIILVLAVLATVAVVTAVRFAKQPRDKQVAAVKEWLLVAVLEAERQFGSGTGKLKLRTVYDLFVARFPWMARVVSFDTFAQWVDEALDTVEAWLKDKKIAEYVAGK